MKISYQNHWGNDGTHYDQLIKIDENLANEYNKELQNRSIEINKKIAKEKLISNADMEFLRYTIELNKGINYLKHTGLVIFLGIAYKNGLDTKRIKLDRNTIIQVL